METLHTQLPPGASVQTSLESLQITLPVRSSSSGKASVHLNAARVGAVLMLGLFSAIAYLYVSAYCLMFIERLFSMGRLEEVIGALVFFVGFGKVMPTTVVQSNRKIKARIAARDEHYATFVLERHTLTVPLSRKRTQSIELAEVLFFSNGPPPRAQLKDKRSISFAHAQAPDAQAWLVSVCQAALKERGDATVYTEAVPATLRTLTQQQPS